MLNGDGPHAIWMHTHDLYSFETDDPSLAGPFRRASEVPEPVRGLQLYVLKPRIQRSSPDPTQPTASVVPTRGKSRTVEVFQPPSAEVFKTLSGNHTQLQGLLEFVDNAIEAIRKKQIESRAVSAAAAESSERAVPLQTHKQVTPAKGSELWDISFFLFSLTPPSPPSLLSPLSPR